METVAQSLLSWTHTETDKRAVEEIICLLVGWLVDRKEQSFQAVVSSWMVQLETAVSYKDGLAEALSTRCVLLIQVTCTCR